MKLNLHRIYFGETYTIGRLSIDGEYFCDTLEDKYRDLSKEAKVYGKTAIPFGTYKVLMTYSAKFRRKLPILLNVPHFEGIRIHSGNIPEHTEGCILVGENKEKGKVLNSKKWETKLIAILEDCPNIEIEII